MNKEALLKRLEEIKAKKQAENSSSSVATAPAPKPIEPDKLSNALVKRLEKQATKDKDKKEVSEEELQSLVDEYIKLDAEYKKIESRMKQIRSVIEPHMMKESVDVIEGTDRGRIEIVPTNRADITARYTTYDPYAVLSITPPEYRNDIIKEVVDREVVDYLVKTGKIPKSVSECKTLIETYIFRAKHL